MGTLTRPPPEDVTPAETIESVPEPNRLPRVRAEADDLTTTPDVTPDPAPAVEPEDDDWSDEDDDEYDDDEDDVE